MIQTPTNNFISEDEIDFRHLAAVFKRRWVWIATCTFAGALTSSVLTVMSKQVWAGEFQIVVSDAQQGGVGALSSLVSSNPMLASIAGIRTGGVDTELQTELKILESPSVLRPVFEYVKTTKQRNGDAVAQLRFGEWIKSSLTFKLEKGTSVLSITYRDSDKSLVLPVMRQISKAYQQYSGRERSESISNGLIYAEEQVAKFRQQADTSNRALDAFSIRYGISSDGAVIGSGGIDVGKVLGSLKQNTNNISSLINFQGASGSSRNDFKNAGDPMAQLAAVNLELIRRQQQFTSRDPGVQALIRERDALRQYTEMTAGGALALPGQRPGSKEQAQELIIKYKELERRARRDTATLDSLESALLSLQLEQARSSKPWELISKPTLFDKPVSPSRARNLGLGLLAGLIAGSGAGLFVDRISGRIFNKGEILKAIPLPLLADLPLDQPSSWHDSLQLLAHHDLQGMSLAVLPMGEVSQKHCNALVEGLMNAGLNTVELCRTPLATEGFDQQLLLACAGSCKRQGLSKLVQELRLQQKTPLGLIWLDNSASNG